MTDDTDLRAIDRQLAETMMGWEIKLAHARKAIWKWIDPEGLSHDSLPPFSADTPEGWAAMKLVYERMLQADPNGDMVTNGPFFGRYTARWRRHDDNGLWGDEATADSLPAAVALAAIAALEGHDATTYGSCLQRVGDDPR